MNKGVTILLMAGVGALFAFLASRPPAAANPPPPPGTSSTTDGGRAGFADFGIQDAGSAW